MLGPLDLNLIWTSLPDLFSGLVVTLQLTVLTVIGGILLSVPLGVLRTSPNRFISGPIWAYTYFFRGTPMLIQLFLIYYGLAQFKAVRSSGLWFILRDGYWCCLIAFTLNTAAYTIEIIAGALRNVPLGDIEAARAMGMSPFTILRRIKFPIALRILFPAYTNEVVFILQSTSLASLVTVMDLTGAARVVIARTFAPYEMFITIGAHLPGAHLPHAVGLPGHRGAPVPASAQPEGGGVRGAGAAVSRAVTPALELPCPNGAHDHPCAFPLHSLRTSVAGLPFPRSSAARWRGTGGSRTRGRGTSGPAARSMARSRRPSTCDDRKGRYHCFGCKASGDIFTFLVEKEGLSFPEAVERLAAGGGAAHAGRLRGRPRARGAAGEPL